jgi:hypothetical protein
MLGDRGHRYLDYEKLDRGCLPAVGSVVSPGAQGRRTLRQAQGRLWGTQNKVEIQTEINAERLSVRLRIGLLL